MLKKIEEFCLFCSGVDRSLLKKINLPSENNKFVMTGAAILVTCSTASLSFGYGVFSITASVVAAVPLGVFWGGVVIFSIDRWFLTSARKRKAVKGWERLGHMISPLLRIGLALSIGVVIAIPLELGIFRQEIFAEALQEQEVTFNQDIERLTKENKRLTQELKAINLEQTKDFASVIANRRRRASSYEEQKKTLQNAIKTNTDIINQKQQELSERQIPRLGLLQQMMYLERLMQKYPSIRHNVYWLKTLLITLEILPILAKLSSPYGVYDAVLETNEQTQIHLQKETLRANKIQIERDAEREQQYRETLSQKVYAELLAASIHHVKVVLHDLEKSVEFEARRADLTAEMADRITDTIKDTMTPPALPETSLAVREPASGTLSIREILDQMIRKNSI